MTGIVGILSYDTQASIKSELDEMLTAMEHRGPKPQETYKRPGGKTIVAVLSTNPTDTILDASTHGGMILFHGHCLESIEKKTLNLLKQKIGIDRHRVDQSLMVSGVIAVDFSPERLTLYRSEGDSLPMYFAYGKDMFCFATERKALWKVGLLEIMSLDPGRMVRVSIKEPSHSEYSASQGLPPVIVGIRKSEALRALEHALNLSFKRLSCSNHAAVLFSGGVDSSLAALMTKEYTPKTTLVSAFVEGSHDDDAARKAANLFGMSLEIVQMTPELIWKILPDVILSIERNNRMDVEIAIPFFLCADAARKFGADLVVSGQGPDELFGGYARYVELCEKLGIDALTDALLGDVSVTHSANIERDERAVAFHRMSCVFPYMDPQFSRLALSIPPDFKIHLGEDPVRKVIFRELAETMGVPKELAFAEKKATQYSSGSSKILMKAVEKYGEDCQGISKKELSSKVQQVLDGIALDVGVPKPD